MERIKSLLKWKRHVGHTCPKWRMPGNHLHASDGGLRRVDPLSASDEGGGIPFASAGFDAEHGERLNAGVHGGLQQDSSRVAVILARRSSRSESILAPADRIRRAPGRPSHVHHFPAANLPGVFFDPLHAARHIAIGDQYSYREGGLPKGPDRRPAGPILRHPCEEPWMATTRERIV